MGRTATVAPKALLVPLCGNPDCDATGVKEGVASRMYRFFSPYKHGKVAVYRCTGSGPQRKGCGAPCISCDDLDALVLNLSEYWDSRPYVTQVFVPGNDVGAEIEVLKDKLAQAVTRQETNEIWDAIEALEAQGSILSHWESVDSGMTEGEHLRSLDLEGRREYLAHKEIRAWAESVKVEGRKRPQPTGRLIVTIEDVEVSVSPDTITLNVQGVSVTVPR